MDSTASEKQVEIGNQASQARLENGKVEITLAPTERRSIGGKCMTPNVKKVVYGLMLVIGIAVSWVSTSQFIKSTYSSTFNAPFFTIWFSTSWTIVCYPVYVIGSFLLFKEKWKGGLRPLFKEDQTVYGPKGLTLLTFFKYVAPFCFCWAATNYMYIRALGSIQVTDTTALFATNTAFVYICSWIWLKEKFVLIPARSFSVLLSIVGTVVICYADGFGGGRAEGVILALCSSLGAALYKVLFFRCVGNASYGQVSLFLSFIGLFNLVFLWPVMLTLYLTNVETIDWGNLPTRYLCGSATLSLVFNFLVNFGIAITFPLFIAMGTIIGIPLNGVVDWLFRGTSFGWVKIVGAVLIVAGFLIMLVPESIQRKVACWREGQCPCERQKLDEEGAEPAEEAELAEGEGVGLQAGDEETEQKECEDWQMLEQCEDDDV